MAAAGAGFVGLAVPGDEEPVEDRLGPGQRVVAAGVGDGEHGHEALEVPPPALLTLALALGAPSVAGVGRAEDVELRFLVHGAASLSRQTRRCNRIPTSLFQLAVHDHGGARLRPSLAPGESMRCRSM